MRRAGGTGRVDTWGPSLFGRARLPGKGRNRERENDLCPERRRALLNHRVVGLEGVRAEIAMVETPDGHGRLELTKFHARRARAATGTRRRTPRASAISHSQSTTSTPSSPVCEPTRGARWRGGELRRHLSALLRPRPGGDHRRAGGADRLRGSGATRMDTRALACARVRECTLSRVSEEAARAASSALATVDTAGRLLDRDLEASDYAGVAASRE
jgi:hypothetical protein